MEYSYISKAPTPTTELTVHLEIQALEQNHIQWWIDHVQTHIDHRMPHCTDYGWRWKRHFAIVSTIERRQDPAGLAVVVPDHPRERPLICGILLLARNYVYPVERDKSAIHVWYLSTIPPELIIAGGYYGPFGMPKQLGQILIDVAVTESYRKGHEGRILLHADPKGGDKFMRFYQDTCGMSRDMGAQPISRIRYNDGRYFYFTEEQASQFRARLTALR